MLLELARTAAEAVRSSGSLILINDRSDVAAIARVGVHLTTRSMDPCVTRRLMHGGASFAGQKDVAKSNDQALIGASTHLLDEVVAAEDLGADFVVFGPIFETSSKREYGPPVGVKALEQVTKRVSIPVLGLGGIDSTNFGQVLDAGAAGVAGISMFATATDLPGLVAQIKAASKQAD
jgi:thiamine-phosphate pyrophosphorylase